MSETCKTVKVKSDAPDNALGFVVINESDFDPAVHELVKNKLISTAQLADLSADLIAGFVPVKEPSDGLTVAELKAELEAKGIAIPEGAKKADLAALLDSQPA